jgi:hypothetical protein
MNHGVPSKPRRSCTFGLSFIPTFSNMDSTRETSTEKAVGISSPNSEEYVETQGFDEKATKRMIRKIDWNLIPFLALIYL